MMAFGHLDNHVEMRIIIVMELALNLDTYLDDEFLKSGHECEDYLPTIYAMYSGSHFRGKHVSKTELRGMLCKKDQDHKENIYNLEKKAVMSAPPAEEGDCIDGRVQIGEEVWVRPGDARCTTRWGRGNVTGVNSANNIEVDGVPRQNLDVRPVVEEVPEGLTANVEDEIRRYPRRDRHAPTWMRDYVSE